MSTTRKFGGTGLGLHITRVLVDAHSGSIRVISELGAGASFIVTLPVIPPESDIGVKLQTTSSLSKVGRAHAPKLSCGMAGLHLSSRSRQVHLLASPMDAKRQCDTGITCNIYRSCAFYNGRDVPLLRRVVSLCMQFVRC